MVVLDGHDAGRAQREALGWELYAGHDSGIVMLDDTLNRPGEEVEIEDVPGEALILPKRTFAFVAANVVRCDDAKWLNSRGSRGFRSFAFPTVRS